MQIRSPILLVPFLLACGDASATNPEPPMCTPALLEVDAECRALTYDELRCLLDHECALEGWED